MFYTDACREQRPAKVLHRESGQRKLASKKPYVVSSPSLYLLLFQFFHQGHKEFQSETSKASTKPT